MKNLQIRLLHILCWVCPFLMMAQELPTVIPPSPTVANLMQFEEVPIDYYSGQANIQFPIYNKRLGNFNLPLVLRYNTMGLRVDERSGWVGKGWSLDGEIVISRTVRGFRDEAKLGVRGGSNPDNHVGVFHNGFFDLDLDQNWQAEYQDTELQNFLWNASGKGSGKYGFNEYSYNNIYTRNGAFDKEPDLYQLSLIGQSARFFLARVGNTLEVRMLSNESNLRVEPTYDTTNYEVSAFTVTDTQGSRYVLDVTENTTNTTVTGIVPQYGANGTLSNQSTSEFISAWKVSQIFSENNELLATYSYDNVYEAYKLNSTISEATLRNLEYLGNMSTSFPLSMEFFFGETGGGTPNQYQSENRGKAIPERTYTYNYAQIDTKKLANITFRDNSSIAFSLSSQAHPEYEDGASSVLDEVKVYDQGGSLHKRFDFNYNIVTSQPLFLDGIDEYFTGTNKLSYSFAYKDKHLLPMATHTAFDSNANKDIWGYYKSVDNSLGPVIYKLPNESADKDKVMTGSLESITYPTGGKKVFEFESNTFSHRGARPFTDAEFKAFNQDNWNLGTNLSSATVIFNNIDNSPASVTTSQAFDITDQQTLEFIPTVFQMSPGSGGGLGGTQTPEEYVENILIQLQEQQSNGTYLAIDTFSFFQRRTLELMPGTYRLHYINMSLAGPSDPSVHVQGVLYFKTYKEQIDRLIYGGGLRIKSVKFLDSDNSVENQLNYSYNENSPAQGLPSNEAQISSGAIDGMLSDYKEYIMPKTHIFTQLNGEGGNAMQYTAFPTRISYLIRDYLNGTHTSLTKGNHVGYRKVSMSQSGNGRTEFIYTTSADAPTEDITYGWPFIPNEDQSHRHGLLLSQRVFNNDGLILADTKNTYYDPIETSVGKFLHLADDPGCYWSLVYERYSSYLDKTIDIPAYSTILSPANNCTTLNYSDVPVWKWARDLNFTKVLLKSTVNKSYTYGEDGTQYITQSEDAFIYEPENWQIKEKTTTLTEAGQTVDLKTKYYYAVGADISSNTTAIKAALRANNKINEILATQTFRDGIQLSENQTLYGDFNGLLLPSSVKVAKGTDTAESRVNFYDYDQYGNPLEVGKEDGTPISYIWGYEQTMPIAKGINVTQSQISTALGGAADFIAGLSATQQTALRNSSSGSQWSFYEYDPMIGITKSYDTRGYAMSYNYDAYYRLKEVKDQSGYLLSSNSYMYGLQNYVKTTAYQVETTNGFSHAISGAALTSDNKLENITYMDGLGRAIQSIGKQTGGNKQDVIGHVDYDALGRQAKEYLPYADPNQTASVSTLDFRDPVDLLNDLEAHYIAKFPEDKISNTSINAYSHKIFETAPLNRVLEQTAPGKAWHYDLANVSTVATTSTIEQILDDVTIDLRDVMFKEVNDRQIFTYDADHAIYPSIGSLNIGSNTLTLDINLSTYDNFGTNQKLGDIAYINSGLYTLDNIVLADITSYSNLNIGNATSYVYLEINNGYLQINRYTTSKSITTGVSVSGLQSEPTYSYNIPTTKQIQYNRLVSSNHSIKFGYEANSLNPSNPFNNSNSTYDNVVHYDVAHANGDTENIQLVYAGHYGKGELLKTITKDENWYKKQTYIKDHTTEEFKNQQGQVVLKRTFNGNVPHDTYYVYDDFGNLTYVLPPKVVHDTSISNTELSELCYQYVYDYRNRLIEKKIPGKDWEYIVFNTLDQPIMTQDANLGASKRWLFTKYDALGRVAYTGLTSSGSARHTLQQGANNTSMQWVTKSSTSQSLGGTAVYYTGEGSVYPNFGLDKIYTINYYDDYNFDLDGGSAQSAYGVTPTTNVMGLTTGSKVRVLDKDKWITSVSYYNEKAQPIYMYSRNNYLGTTDLIKSDLDFEGMTIETETVHARDSYSEIVIKDRFSYDHANRLLKHKQNIGGASVDEVLVSNTYDELGQLEAKGVGGKDNTSRLQQVDYSYNIRGWLRTINKPSVGLNGDLFAFELKYTQPTHASGVGLFNGNIAEADWKTANDNTLFRYTYQYDALNRITKADFNGGNMGARYRLRHVTYDKNGNITALKRDGHVVSDPNREKTDDFGFMDDLYYTYYPSSNRLKQVTDKADVNYGFKDGADVNVEYTYDANGNMVKDENKDISGISYNHLNLPKGLGISSGEIEYVYDAMGTKLAKTTSTGTTTEYAGNFIYENGRLKLFSHPEGYVEPIVKGKQTAYAYFYQYKDHLGNIRITYGDSDNNGSITNSTEIVDENNYYPFGLEHKGYNNVVNGVENNYKTYQGQELTEDLGYNKLEYKWRHFDPALGRFNKIDRFAEKYTPISPYSFIANNPLMYKEVQGDSIQLIVGKKYTDYKGEEHPYGHVALRVFNAEEGYDYVYDFGRYGDVYWNQNGDGILIAWDKSSAYFKSEQDLRESIGYTEATTVEEDKKIIDYYQKLIDEGEPFTLKVKKDNRKAYKLKKEYRVKANNCCTISGDGLEQIDSDLDVGEEYDPRELLKTLEKDYKKLGFTRTVYKKGGKTITTYKPIKKSKTGSHKYDDNPIPRIIEQD